MIYLLITIAKRLKARFERQNNGQTGRSSKEHQKRFVRRQQQQNRMVMDTTSRTALYLNVEAMGLKVLQQLVWCTKIRTIK